jgi:hypothetical protein
MGELGNGQKEMLGAALIFRHSRFRFVLWPLMKMNWNRIFSSLIAAIYIILAFVGIGAESAWKVGIFVIFPLAAIWFSDSLGHILGRPREAASAFQRRDL